MNKKARNKLIYIAVAALWAVAIYRTYKNYQINVENESIQTEYISSFSPIAFNKDTFELDLPGQDPFLRTTSYTKSSNHSSNQSGNTNIKKIIKKNPIPIVIKHWPKIEYFGFVKNRNQNKTLCLLKINGNNLQLSKGDSKAGIYVSSVFRDSVHIVFEGEEKTFLK